MLLMLLVFSLASVEGFEVSRCVDLCWQRFPHGGPLTSSEAIDRLPVLLLFAASLTAAGGEAVLVINCIF